MTPERRRKAAIFLLVTSLVLGHVNVGAFLFGWISHAAMDTITNYLSWMAISITALDIVLTADVRVQQKNEE